MTSPTPNRQVVNGGNDVRTVGLLFAILGVLPLLPASSMSRGRWGTTAQIFAAVDAVILIAPGVWYVIAASQIKRLNRSAVTRSLRVAAIQVAAICATLLAAAPLSWIVGMPIQSFVAPAFIAMFFIPALLALILMLRKLRETMNLIEPSGHGFETIPFAAPAQPVQSTDSFRPK